MSDNSILFLNRGSICSCFGNLH